MKEYAIEYGKVNTPALKARLMDLSDYKKAHEKLIILCHDVFIQYRGGILLVKRLNFPAKDMWWPLGGRIKRGMEVKDSLREKVWGEAGLKLSHLTEWGYARTLFKTDPFGHGKGTDTLNLVYFAKGRGSLSVDNLHEKPTIITPKRYKLIRKKLHPYVKDFMDKAIPLIEDA
ncbi:MAG: hypothetical protein KKF50_04150 [Nanoarchaeota archaeon]|nr:hypothetical protein [Nanoarchaeota archaeon]